MTIAVYIDNNVWDFLFERQLDLAAELPRPEFGLSITREAEFEIAAIPETRAELKRFIEETIARCEIKPESFFGFYNEGVPANEQRMAGFGQGRFAELDEVKFMAKQNAMPKTRTMKPGRKLFTHEADVSIAARSLHSIVLTLDKKTALRDASAEGGKVVFLNDFPLSGISLRDYISAAFRYTYNQRPDSAVGERVGEIHAGDTDRDGFGGPSGENPGV